VFLTTIVYVSCEPEAIEVALALFVTVIGLAGSACAEPLARTTASAMAIVPSVLRARVMDPLSLGVDETSAAGRRCEMGNLDPSHDESKYPNE
jgi:hypothetical protein